MSGVDDVGQPQMLQLLAHAKKAAYRDAKVPLGLGKRSCPLLIQVEAKIGQERGEVVQAREKAWKTMPVLAMFK